MIMMKVHLYFIILLVAFFSLLYSEIVCKDGWCEETSVLPLLVTQKNSLKVGEKALTEISKWKTLKLYVLSFIGPGRKGKSTLATRFIPCEENTPGSFQVGSTMEPVTEGIDVWSSEVPFKDGSLMILDTEGTDNPFGTLQNQKRLSLVVSLLSSTVVYNVMDTLTTHDLDKLAEIIDFRQMVKYDSSTDSWPSLIILIQNSRLQFSIKGNLLTNDQFLEYLLEPKGDEHDRSRNLIKSFFSYRTLYTLPTPSPEDLRDIRCPINKETPYYKEFLNFRHSLEKIILPKALGGRLTPPSELVKFIPEFVDGANSDDIDVPSIQARMSEKRVSSLIEEVQNQYPFPEATTQCDQTFRDKVNKILSSRQKEFIRLMDENKLIGSGIAPEQIIKLRKNYQNKMDNESKLEYEPLLNINDRLCIVKIRQGCEFTVNNAPMLMPNFFPSDKLKININLKQLKQKALQDFNSKVETLFLPEEEIELHRDLLISNTQTALGQATKSLREHIQDLAFKLGDMCPLQKYKDEVFKQRKEIIQVFLDELSSVLPSSEIEVQKYLLTSSLDLLEKKRTEEQREFCRPNLKAAVFLKGPQVHCKMYYFDENGSKIQDLSKQDWIRLEEERGLGRFREKTRKIVRGLNLGTLDKWIEEKQNSLEKLRKSCELLDDY